jgi:hypothetical protein
MTNIIAIDPGYAVESGGCACARFFHNELIHAWFVRPEELCADDIPLGVIDTVLWERPVHRVRDEQYSHLPVGVLLELTAVGASLAGMYAAGRCPIVAMKPHEWKRSRHKPPHHKALWRILTPSERAVLGGASTWAIIEAACRKGALARWKPGVNYYPSTFVTHNLLDAVALGCTYLKRMIP